MRKIKIGKVVLTDGGVWNAEKGYPILTYVLHNGDGWWSHKANLNSEPSDENPNWIRATNVSELRTELSMLIDDVRELEDAVARAEEIRTASERQREANERGRVEAETRRGLAEADRNRDEQDRKAGEAARKQKEAERELAEANRERQEARRESESATAVALVNGAIEEAHTQAEYAKAQGDYAKEKGDGVDVEVAKIAPAIEDAEKAAGEAREAMENIEAPKDGKIYGRKNGAWVEAADEKLASDVEDINRDMGKYQQLPDVTLTLVESGKRFDKDGKFVADSNWNIGRLGAVSKGNIYELLMGGSDKMVLGTALFVSHTVERIGGVDTDVYKPIFSAVTTDLPISNYAVLLAGEDYADVLVSYRADVAGSNVMRVSRWGIFASLATQFASLRGEVNLRAFADGYYDNMGVGYARNLIGDGEPTTEEFTERVAGGSHEIDDSIAEYSLIKGNTVVWNQLDKKQSTLTGNGITQASTDDGITTINGIATAAISIFNTGDQGSVYKNLPNGHKGLFVYTVISGTFNGVGGWSYGASGVKSFGSNTEFIKTSSTNYEYFLQSIKQGDTFDDFKFRFQVFDLTKMFGAGNEPTIEQFKQWFPKDYYPYNEGTIVNMTAEGVKTTSADGSQTSERKWTDTMKKCFPEGMAKVGSVYDEMGATKAVKRIGVVDLGSLEWIQQGGRSLGQFSATLESIAHAAKMLSSNYPFGGDRVSWANAQDKTMYSVSTQPWIWIKDTAYTDVASFKSAMQGVLLYFELAEPIVTTYDELNLTSRVWRGGKEEIIVPEGKESAPIIADMVYQINAFKTIKANKQGIEDLQAKPAIGLTAEEVAKLRALIANTQSLEE